MKKNKEIDYEILNVANEVVFTGSAASALEYCRENKHIAAKIREKGKEISLPADLWATLAGKVEKFFKAREDKKKKKEEKKWRKKEKKSLNVRRT